MTQHVDFSGQISAQQMDEIAKKGYRTIINNRPDNESDDQPSSAQLEAAAKQAGLAYKHLGFASNELTQPIVEDFADYYNQADKPILMFCRTGNRSNGLYDVAKKMDLLDDD